TMSKVNSTQPKVQSKPERPEGSPLFWHKSGRWCKKIRGKFHYFGRGTHDEALELYNTRKDNLHAGRQPEQEPEGLTLYKRCAKFLTRKMRLRGSGDLSIHTYTDYAAVCKLLLKAFDKNRLVSDLKPGDFEKLRAKMLKKWNLVRVGNTINKVRIVFNYGYKNGLIERQMVYGEGFKRPSKKALRKHRQAQGPRMFEAEEIRAMLAKAGPALKAMILLGVNCGFGNSDIGNLPMSALDLERGWISYPRPKT